MSITHTAHERVRIASLPPERRPPTSICDPYCDYCGGKLATIALSNQDVELALCELCAISNARLRFLRTIE